MTTRHYIRAQEPTGPYRPRTAGQVLSDLIGEGLRAAQHEELPLADDRAEDGESGRFDFDLAEFPLFRFHKRAPGRTAREPLVYQDEIRGAGAEPVRREWKAYPGPFGFGGPSTQVLLYDLLQLYAEQGGAGSQLQFGTLRSLLLRRGERNPSKRDYDRVRRDMDVLRGYDFHCKNAFWDPAKRAYADMNWRLFGAVFYFKHAPAGAVEELPFGFIEVSPTLQRIARERGFFPLGFGRELFYRLRPLEQRLAVYLAKKFASQPVHRRVVDDLAAALPIEAARPRDVRAILKDAATGLVEKRVGILRSFAVTGPRDDRWVAEFVRGTIPAQTAPAGRRVLSISDRDDLVERIVAETGGAGDRLWWAQCVARLGRGPVERALGQFREACAGETVRSRPALLTKILKDLAAERGVALR